MKQIILKGTLILAALIITGLGIMIPPANLGFADYLEECVNEGCDHEEAKELTEVHNEECIQESCDQEEIQETFGVSHFPDFSEHFYAKWERGVHSTDNPTSNQAWNAKTLDLGESLFAPVNNRDDNDNDYLADSLEHKLAEEFKPLLIFDSDENARLPNEPVTLFQVRPRGCIGEGCNNIYTVDLKYLFLWQWDGGYGPDSSCGNEHEGDNQAIDLVLQSKDGHRWKLTYLNIWTGGYGFQKEWSLDSNGNDSRHFHFYLSAGKHHHFFDTTYDHEDTPFGVPSPFSPCNEDVNGRGARIQPKLSDTYCFPSGTCKEVPLNVGESNAHSTEHFINDLTSLGYQGENAWGQQPFRGGLGGDSDDTAANSTIWIKTGELKYLPTTKDLGGALPSSPECVSWGPNRLDCFYRGLGREIIHRWWNGSQWKREVVGGTTTSNLSCTTWGPNRLDCFYRGLQQEIVHRWWDGNKWRRHYVGGSSTSDPECTSWGVNRLDCFYRGLGQEIIHRWWDGSQWKREVVGGTTTSNLSCTTWGPNRLDCFYRGLQQEIVHRWWDGNKWRRDYPGGSSTSDPECTSWGINRLDCFYRGLGQEIIHRWWNGSQWKREVVGGTVNSNLSCTTWGPNQLDCFYRGLQQEIVHRWWDGNKWRRYYVGGSSTSDPKCISWGTNRLDCFYRGEQKELIHRWWNGSKWQRETVGGQLF